MTRYAAKVEYDGTNYRGFQSQAEGATIQQTLEAAFTALFGVPTAVTGSGRTDAGVHALGQIIHFDADTVIPERKLPLAVRRFLPQDVSVLEVQSVPNDFHARFSATEKTYRYAVLLSAKNRPVYRNRAAIFPYPVDVDAMRNAAQYLLGTHDFVAFSASGSNVKTTVRTIKTLEISLENELLTFTITANGFLYNMVRILVGSLMDVGRGKFVSEDIARILNVKDRNLSGKTAPACGLYLLSVLYENFSLHW